jgi:hypothetical protein
MQKNRHQNNYFIYDCKYNIFRHICKKIFAQYFLSAQFVSHIHHCSKGGLLWTLIYLNNRR